MKNTTDPPDLSALARDPGPSKRPRRRWTRVLLAVLAIGFVGLLVESARDAWFPRREVEIVRPVAVSGSATVAARGTVLAEFAGFVEPDPEPIHVTARVDSVYLEVLHRDGDSVSAGAVLARLDDADAKSRLAAAEAALTAADAIVENARARSELAARERERAPDLGAALAAAEAREEAASVEAEHRAAAVSGAEALRDVARLELEREELLLARGAAGPKQLEIARARLAAAESEIAIRRADEQKAAAEARAATIEKERARVALELKSDVASREAEARSALATALADRAEASARRDSAAREVERCVLVAPRDGIVSRANAAPGARPLSDQPAFTLFDPDSLRCRVDVPLAQLSRIAVGGDARVTPEGSTRGHAARVERISGQADVAKVALRVYVKLLETSGDLVPERVCRVEFTAGGANAASGSAASGADSAPRGGVTIPRVALRGDGSVLVLDVATNRARRRAVTEGARPADPDLVIVTSGIDVSDKVIVDPEVREGDAVVPRAEGTSR